MASVISGSALAPRVLVRVALITASLAVPPLLGFAAVIGLRIAAAEPISSKACGPSTCGAW